MIRSIIAPLLAAALSVAAEPVKPNPSLNMSREDIFKSSVLARCLVRALENDAVVGFDAGNSSSYLNATLKLPNALESFGEVASLIDKTIKTPFRIQEKGHEALYTLTCLNLYHSSELAALTKKYVKD